jgi:hypothetical protein
MGNRQTSAVTFFAALGLIALAPSSGCSSKSNPGSPDDDGGAGGSSSGSVGFGQPMDSGPPVMSCPSGTNFQCTTATCSGSTTTTLTGTVYDPAGKIPLDNVAVYVPNEAAVTLPTKVSCGNCSSWYTPPAFSTLTDTGGNFTLKNMPVGANIPLIIQDGKWRMQYTLSNVTACQENKAASLVPGGVLRMPRNHMEGDIPNIAVSTGAADSLECLLYRMGIDKSEYTGDPAGAGRIHIFTGGNEQANPPQSGAITNAPMSKQSYQYLWGSDDQITPYDLVLLSCEGSPTAYLNQAAQEVLNDYTNMGGRVFASHFHFAWFIDLPGQGASPFDVTPPLATWVNTDNNAYVGDPTAPQNGDIVTTLPNGMPFPEGASLKQWLQNVGALTNGQLPIYYSRDNATLSATNTHSQPWVTLDPSTPAPNAAQYFSFDTPLGVSGTEQCGRVVYSDLHVSGGAGSQSEPNVPPDYPNFTTGGLVPDGCADHDLTPQEKALEFMIFDLSSCLTPPGQVTVAPPPE